MQKKLHFFSTQSKINHKHTLSAIQNHHAHNPNSICMHSPCIVFPSRPQYCKKITRFYVQLFPSTKPKQFLSFFQSCQILTILEKTQPAFILKIITLTSIFSSLPLLVDNLDLSLFFS